MLDLSDTDWFKTQIGFLQLFEAIFKSETEQNMFDFL